MNTFLIHYHLGLDPSNRSQLAERMLDRKNRETGREGFRTEEVEKGGT